MIRPRPHLAGLEAVVHGGVSAAELAALGRSSETVLDFSVNINPLGPPPAVVAAVKQASWTSYPDDGVPSLRRALAHRDGVSEQQVVVGNGSVELLWLIAIAFLSPSEPVVVVGPTFGEYARAARIAGAVVREYRAPPEGDFAVDVTAVIALARAVQARALFLANPNNPTGALLPALALAELAARLPTTLLVIDEAYRAFADDPPNSGALLERENVILLRSLTKEYALPGLRLGYALAPASLARVLDAVRPPWNVNAIAAAAGLAALAESDYRERARAVIREARTYLDQEFRRRGFRVIPSAANYLLVEVGNGARVRAALLARGICVRDCASFGLPGFIRIGVRTRSDCARLIAALDAAGIAGGPVPPAGCGSS
ncbi:MAG: threonine-phosphate decarboxylase [Chloroflexi bacterium]|nr:threonine-phosphate decarboxylase [Chloroflexota bacterium]